jgi:hypothetical protein
MRVAVISENTKSLDFGRNDNFLGLAGVRPTRYLAGA